MHIHLDDQYIAGDSLVHRLDPRTKVVIALVFILTAALAPMGALAAYAVLLVFALSVAALAGVGLSYVVRRSFIALPFALAAVTLPFTVPGETLFRLPLFGGVTASVEGAVRFGSILVKSWISVQMAILLVAVTPFPDLLWGLLALRVPRPLVSIVSVMYRYLFVLSDEALRMMRARASRSAAAEGYRSGGSLVWRSRVAGRMAGSLMLRSYERSERIFSAMLARGYRGQIRTVRRFRLARVDYVILFVCLTFFASVLLITQLLT